MSYHVKESDNKFSVVEKGTDLVIKTTSVQKEARDLCRSLNLGAGFDGWTPEFFTYVYKDLK